LLHSIHSVNPTTGGTSTFLRQIIQAHKEAGNQVEVVCLDSPAEPYLSNLSVPVHALGPGLLKYGWTASFVPWMRRNAPDFDVIIVDGLWQYTSFGTWLALKGMAVPYVVFPHGMLDPWFNQAYPLKKLKKRIYWPLAEAHVLRDARAVFFTYEEERLRAGQSFRPWGCNERILGLGIDDPPDNATLQKQAFLSTFPALAGKRLLLYLGRLHKKKGCDLLLEAFARLAPVQPDLHLVMAGPCRDDYALRLKKHVERKFPEAGARITWTGMLDGEIKWGALCVAEALILPSHQENFGLVVAEATACATPVLISDRVNIWREIVEDGAGLVGHDDLEGTTELIRSWYQFSPDTRAQMARAARQCFTHRFEMGTVFKRFLGQLEQIVQIHPCPTDMDGDTATLGP